ETIKRAIEIDAGIGLLPEPTVAHEVAAGKLCTVPLATQELVRPLGIIHRQGKELGVTMRRFIELLCAGGKPHPAPAAPSETHGDSAFNHSNGRNREVADERDDFH